MALLQGDDRSFT